MLGRVDAEQRDVVVVVHIGEHGECDEPQEMEVGSGGELEYYLENDECVDEPETAHGFVQTNGHLPQEMEVVDGLGVVAGQDPFDRSDQIIDDTDEQQGNDQIIPQLFPEHPGVAFFLAQEAGDDEEQRHAEHIDIAVVEGEEMAIDDQDDSDGFHPIQPV